MSEEFESDAWWGKYHLPFLIWSYNYSIRRMFKETKRYYRLKKLVKTHAPATDSFWNSPVACSYCGVVMPCTTLREAGVKSVWEIKYYV